jgi:hypothetical protein
MRATTPRDALTNLIFDVDPSPKLNNDNLFLHVAA